VQLWQSWARMEQRLGDAASALRLYERAVRFYGNDRQLLVEWAKLLTEEGDVGKARSVLQRVTSKLRPGPYAFQCFAALEQKVGNVDRARSLYKRGAALRADDIKAREELVPLLHAWAVFEWSDGERAAARKLFERAEAVSPNPCGWLFQWHARFEADVGNVVLARHYYARAVNAAPRDSSAWRMWAELEQGLGQEGRAEAFMRRSNELEKESWMHDSEGGSPLRRRGLR